MNIAVFGTGTVGQVLAGKLADIGHQVVMGTRDVTATLAKKEPDGMGNPPVGVWLSSHSQVKLTIFAKAAASADLIINATSGYGSLVALTLADSKNLEGKILIDISNPLDFSQGMPPFLFVSNQDSLGEQIQKAFPGTRVVKTLNTMTAALMVQPALAAEGNHSVFMSGNDLQAKHSVSALLQEFGWKDIIDLGDISTARGTEMLLPIWIRLWGALGTPMFGFKIAR